MLVAGTRAYPSDARPPMELAKGVRDLAKDGVATGTLAATAVGCCSGACACAKPARSRT